MPDAATLAPETVREALRLLGDDQASSGRTQAVRALRELLSVPGAVRTLVDRAPEGARAAFARLATDGPAAVEDLLDRGWWGHGTLPPPLDWLQRRALVTIGPDALVHALDEARRSFLDLAFALDLSPDPPGSASAAPSPAAAGPDPWGAVAGSAGAEPPLRVERAGCVVVAPGPAALDRALNVPAAGLRAVAPTVATSERSSGAVAAALRAAGVALDEDNVVPLRARGERSEPALPTASEDAVGPRAVRLLLNRAVGERRQVRLRYFASSRGGAATDRVVDPWTFTDDLLRGWCHLRLGERTFAVDRIGHARLLPTLVDHEPT